MTFQDKLGNALVEGGFITQEQLKRTCKAAEEEGKRFTEVLVEKRLISREVLATALSFLLKIVVVNLKQVKIDERAVKLIPEEFARQHEVLPFALEDNGVILNGALRVAMERPDDFDLINALSRIAGRSIRPALSLDVRVRDMIEKAYHPKPAGGTTP